MTREEAVKVLKEHKGEYFHTSRIEHAIDMAIEALSEPSIVRCVDCRWYNKGENESESWKWCRLDAHRADDNWFCSFGERREP